MNKKEVFHEYALNKMYNLSCAQLKPENRGTKLHSYICKLKVCPCNSNTTI